MQTLKMQELLFRNRKKDTIRLAGKTVNAQGPRGIRSLCRPGTAGDSPAKYSNLGLILDSIFLDHAVIGMQSDISIYAKFYSSGSRFIRDFTMETRLLGKVRLRQDI